MPFIAYLIVFAVALAVAVSVQPAMPEQPPATLKDMQLPTAEPGRPIPVVFGTFVVTGANVVWYGDLVSRAVRAEGGK